MSERGRLVADALEPVQYRVYPETPLSEVIDLMVRRGAGAVPVVGERYEVLGVISAGDVLEYVLGSGAQSAGDGDVPELQAKDLMTRSVLCVSEEQPLQEAARIMVSRGVNQLPVVREGELVGFVTRESVLRALHGSGAGEEDASQPDA